MLMTLFFNHRIDARLQKADAVDAAAQKIHANNMKTIAEARKTADNLKQILEENGISLELYEATRHTNGTSNKHTA